MIEDLGFKVEIIKIFNTLCNNNVRNIELLDKSKFLFYYPNFNSFLNDNSIKHSSSYFNQTRDKTSISWHLDGNFPHFPYYTEAMALNQLSYGVFYICSYPYNTQILSINKNIKINPTDWTNVQDEFNIIQRNCKVKELIKFNKAKVISLRKGHLYRLSSDIIHRTNPKSIGKPQLLIRGI